MSEKDGSPRGPDSGAAQRRRFGLRKIVTFGAAGTVLAALLWLNAAGASPPPLPDTLPPIEGADSSLIAIEVDTAARHVDIIVGPVSLAANTPGYRAPIQLARIPVDGALNAFSWSITDAAGNELPRDMLHHVNLIDPDQRDLFAPVARRVLAAGRETDPYTFPGIVGYPLADGTRFLVVAMFANNGPEDVDAAYLRVRLSYVPLRGPVRPLAIFPFSLDVMGPVGEKSFPVPPGRTVQSWEGSPAVDARLLAIGGHAHDHATLLRLEDITDGTVLWEMEPVRDGSHLVSVPVTTHWKSGGIRVRRDHRYRVTVVYENETDGNAPHGGMGVVAGVAWVREQWPELARNDSDYATDLHNVLTAPFRANADGDDGHMMHGHVH